jgi:hypothetical protein
MPRQLRVPVSRGCFHYSASGPHKIPLLLKFLRRPRPLGWLPSLTWSRLPFSTSSSQGVNTNFCLPLPSVHNSTKIFPYPDASPLHPLTCAFSPAPRSHPRFSLPVSPVYQASKRYCSYRRMCHSRRTDAPSGSTNIPASREVLPTNVKPRHYNLTLEPDFEKFNFEGTVEIEYVQGFGHASSGILLTFITPIPRSEISSTPHLPRVYINGLNFPLLPLVSLN